VKEDILPEEPLPGVFAEDHSVQPLEKVVLPHSKPCGISGTHGCQDTRLPVLRKRMGRGPLRGPATLAVPVQGAERPEDRGQLAGVVPGLAHVPNPQIVGLVLRIPAVLEEEQAEARPHQVPELLELGAEDHSQPEPQLGELVATHSAHRVAGRDVADLVSQDPDEFRFGAHVREDAPGDVDESAGHGEGVHERVVHHPEGPGKVRALRCPGHGHPQAPDVALEGRIRVHAHLGYDLGIVVLAHSDLLGLAHQGELAVARRRIDGAGPHQEGKDQESPQPGAAAWPGARHVPVLDEGTNRRAPPATTSPTPSQSGMLTRSLSCTWNETTPRSTSLVLFV